MVRRFIKYVVVIMAILRRKLVIITVPVIHIRRRSNSSAETVQELSVLVGSVALRLLVEQTPTGLVVLHGCRGLGSRSVHFLLVLGIPECQEALGCRWLKG